MKMQKRSSKKYLLVIALLTVVITASVVSYFLMKKGDGLSERKPNDANTINNIDYTPPTDDQVNPSTDPPTPPRPSDNESLNVKISSANQVSGTLQVRSLISPIISSGECKIKLSKAGSTPIERTSSVQSLSNSSTCQGFDISIGLLAPGNWNILLEVTAAEITGSAERVVLIQ